jgi:Ner family transcriptional regulator
LRDLDFSNIVPTRLTWRPTYSHRSSMGNLSQTRPSSWDIPALKAALERKGITVTGLARKHGFHRSAVSTALRRPWLRVERIIADAIGTKPHLIWPERYDARGNPLHRPGRPGSNAHHGRGK